MPDASLNAFLDRLLERSDGEFQSAEWPVQALLDASPPPPEERPYARNLLRADARGEVLAMTWKGGVRCAPHDHDQARGHVFVLRGRLRERQLKWRDGELKVHDTQTAEPGDRLAVPDDYIHDMAARPADVPAVTLHLYRPQVRRMRVFDVDNRRTLVVGEGCGAWLPADPDGIVREESWVTP